MRSVRVELLTTCDAGTAREWTACLGERGPGFGVFVHAVDPPNASSPRCACADVEQRTLTGKLVAEVGVSAYDLSPPSGSTRPSGQTPIHKLPVRVREDAVRVRPKTGSGERPAAACSPDT